MTAALPALHGTGIGLRQPHYREVFERRYDEVKRRFAGQDVQRPAHWGGYRVIPDRIEFWSDRPHRLHERRLFTRDGTHWIESMLYP